MNKGIWSEFDRKKPSDWPAIDPIVLVVFSIDSAPLVKLFTTKEAAEEYFNVKYKLKMRDMSEMKLITPEMDRDYLMAQTVDSTTQAYILFSG